MQLSSFAASIVGALTSAGVLEFLEVLPWREFLGVAVGGCSGSASYDQCLTQEELPTALHHERFQPQSEDAVTVSCPPIPECQCGCRCAACPECLTLPPIESGISTAGAATISFAVIFSWIACFFVGRWSARRGRGGGGLGRPPTRARPALVSEGAIVPSLARRSGAR